MPRKAASGSGTIRKKTITRSGKQYTYWEARYTEGSDPGTGKQIQRTITGKTQKEVAKKLKEATAALDAGTYTAPTKMTVGQWLEIWQAEYLGNVKERTAATYKSAINTRINPSLGAIQLTGLSAHKIQSFYNSLTEGETPVSPKMVKNIHGILHRALQQAVLNRYLPYNPADACILPRVEKAEIQPLDDTQISAFLKAIKGHRYEYLYITALFTGMRESEVLGLRWDCVDLQKNIITVNAQLQKVVGSRDQYHLVTTKNSKARTIAIAPYVASVLHMARLKQLENRLLCGDIWQETGLVFTNGTGGHLCHKTVYGDFKKIAAQIGIPNARFHDLRHSYAVASIRSGDDIKTVQGNLGHATAAFTLDIYGHVTDQMKQASAARMEKYIQAVK